MGFLRKAPMVEAAGEIDFSKYLTAIHDCQPMVQEGRIVKVAGLVAEADGPSLGLGSLCAIEDAEGRHIPAEVVGFNDKRIIIMPLEDIRGLAPGSRLFDVRNRPTIMVGDGYLGRVIDGLGRPLDGGGPITGGHPYPLQGCLMNPLKRRIIQAPMDVGVCAINGLLTLGKGQRIGIMAGSGVGKSVLLGMIARNTTADVNVIALIGERGREVREFIERILGAEGLQRSVVVAATSDSPAPARIRGAHLATAMAEYFRDQGLDVILMMDSVTRFAMAMREVGLAAGEPPSAKGYTPSVFAQIPKLLERAGTTAGKGSITGIYSVLVEGDDMNEPVADAVRSILDGHVVLSRNLAHQGHYPAIDVLASISRVMKDIVDAEHLDQARRLIQLLAAYRSAEDLIQIGAYSQGSDPRIDLAQKMIGPINSYLQQGIEQAVSLTESRQRLAALLGVEP